MPRDLLADLTPPAPSGGRDLLADLPSPTGGGRDLLADLPAAPELDYAPIPGVQFNPSGVGVAQATRRGFADLSSLLGSGSSYLGERFDSDLLRDQGTAMKDYWSGVAAENPLSPRSQASPLDDPSVLADPVWHTENLARMGPSFVGPLGVAGVAGKAALATMPGWPKLAALFGATAGGTFGGALEGASTYEEGLASGADEPTAARAGEAMAAGTAALNALPLHKIMNPAARGVIYNFLSRGLMEGVTESMEEPLDEIIQGLAYDKPMDWVDVARRAAHVFPGAFMLGGGAGVSGLDGRTDRPVPESPLSPPTAPGRAPRDLLADLPPQAVDPLSSAIEATTVQPSAATPVPPGPAQQPGQPHLTPAVNPPSPVQVPVPPAEPPQPPPGQAPRVPAEPPRPAEPPPDARNVPAQDTNHPEPQVVQAVEQLNANSAGVPRAEMPQIRSNRQPEFVESMIGDGVVVSRGQVRAGDLKATQNDTDPARAAKSVATLRQGRTIGSVEGGTPIVVSNDGFILDGHHRIAAFQAEKPDEQLPAIFVDLPIQDLLQRARDFAGNGASGEGRTAEDSGQNIPENIPPAGQVPDRSSMPSDFNASRDTVNQGVQGAPVTVYTPENQPVETRYEVVEAGDLVASHSPDGRPNPAFPADRQPRQRDRAASQAQIQRIAGSLNPALLEQSPTTDTGAPIVDAQNIVESGNGRVAAIQLAARQGNAQVLKDYLIQNAQRFGVDPAQIEAMQSPVLVRRRTTELDDAGQREFARASNVSGAARFSPAEQARVDAERLTDDDMALFEPSEDGNVLAASNRSFVNRFMERVGASDAAGLVDPQGRPNREAASRMQAAVFDKAYRSDDLIQLAAEEADPDIRNILNALQQAAPAFARARAQAPDLADLDVTENIVDAIEHIRTSKRSRISPTAALDQGTLFESVNEDTAKLIRFIDANTRSAKRIGAGLRAMAETVEKELQGRQNQSLLGAGESVTTGEIIDDATRRTEQAFPQPATQQGLFEAGQDGRVDRRGDRGGEPPGRERTEAGQAESPAPGEVDLPQGEPLADDNPPAPYTSDPRQPVNDLAQLMEMAKAGRPQFAKMVRDAAEVLGGKAKIGPLKTWEKASKKVDQDYGGDATRIKDLLRATLLYDTPSEVSEAYQAASDQLPVAQMKRDTWADPTPETEATGYRDALVLLTLPDGMVAELQFNTRLMDQAKEENHGVYDQMVAIEQNEIAEGRSQPSPEAQRRIDALNAKQKAAYDAAAEASLSASRSHTNAGNAPPSRIANARETGRGVAESYAQAPPPSRGTSSGRSPSSRNEKDSSGRSSARSSSRDGGEDVFIDETSTPNVPENAPADESPSGPRGQRGFVRPHPLNDIQEAQKRRFARIERAMVPILSRLRLARDVPEAYRVMLRRFRAEVQKGVRQAEDVAAQRDVLSAEHRKMISDVIEGELQSGIIPPEHVQVIAAQMQEAIETQTEELIRLGMLDRKTADRWRGKYLSRYYVKPKEPIPRALRSTFLRIDGNHLKGRGQFEMVQKRDIQHYKSLGWEIRDPESDSQQVIAKLRDNDKVLMWRDYTRAERERMSEIRDAVYRFARGHMETARDIAVGRLFKAIAESEFAGPRQTNENQVQVPDTEIPGTGGVKRYGSLAGMWVHRDIWTDLEQVRDPDLGGGEIWRQYMRGLSFWKEGKTALNPVVHSNNVWSTWIMADLYGISPWDVKKYRAAYKDYTEKGPFYQEAIDNGLFGTEFYGSEIRRTADTLQEWTNLEQAAASKLRRMIDYGARFSGARAYRRGMGRLYQAEDQFFKLLIFKDMREKGFSIDESIDEAERWVFNYADLPKGARMVKNSPLGLPFFSYTFKAAPALAYAAFTTPWRFAKWVALFGGFNYLAFAALYGPDHEEEEEEERRVMPEFMKGMTPFLTQKNIRWPYDRREGVATYLDLSRRFPMGDMFDMSNQMGGLGIPQPLMPNNPVFTTMMAMFANKDSFTGREVIRDSDSLARAWKKRVSWLLYQGLPNSPVLPFSYSFDKVMNGVAHEMGEPAVLIPGVKEYTGRNFHGEEQTLSRAILSTGFGFKIREYDVQRQAGWLIRDRKSLIDDLRYEIRSLARDQSITDAVRDRQVEDLREQLSELADEARE